MNITRVKSGTGDELSGDARTTFACTSKWQAAARGLSSDSRADDESSALIRVIFVGQLSHLALLSAPFFIDTISSKLCPHPIC